MDDTSMPEGEMPTEASGSKVYASLASLSVEGTAPAVGDQVEFTGSGAIESLHGDQACIIPTEINGEPAGAGEVPAGEPSSEDLRANVDTDTYS